MEKKIKVKFFESWTDGKIKAHNGAIIELPEDLVNHLLAAGVKLEIVK